MTQTKTKSASESVWHRIAMTVARLVCAPLLLLFRVQRVTPEGTPYTGRIEGSALLAANHVGFSDTFVLGATVWYRRMFFLAAEVVMRGKLRSWLLRGVGAIRIDRNAADIEAIRKSVDILKQGDLLAIYPQGGIEKNDQVQSLKSGVALIALQAGVPIIPMHIVKAKHWYSRRKVVIGQPLDPKAYIQKKFPTTADIELVTEKLMEEMNRCAAHQ